MSHSPTNTVFVVDKITTNPEASLRRMGKNGSRPNLSSSNGNGHLSRRPSKEEPSGVGGYAGGNSSRQWHTPRDLDFTLILPLRIPGADLAAGNNLHHPSRQDALPKNPNSSQQNGSATTSRDNSTRVQSSQSVPSSAAGRKRTQLVQEKKHGVWCGIKSRHSIFRLTSHFSYFSMIEALCFR